MGNLSDAEFIAFLNAFIATISADLPSYPGITAAIVTNIGNLRDDMADRLLTHNQAQEAARAATIAKNDARFAAEASVRQMRDLIKANSVPADKYAALGIPVAPSPESTPPLATVPVATIDTSERLRHTINFADAATPNIKRKPRGTDGCEIWVKIDGPPPGNESDCTFLALDTSTPYVAAYAPENAGKTAHYLLRWQLKDGTRTAFGETVSATITA